jgi:hypothetical protein
MVSGIFVNESGRMLVSLFVWIGKRVTILLPIFFYHKLAQSLLTMGFGLVVTPPAQKQLTFVAAIALTFDMGICFRSPSLSLLGALNNSLLLVQPGYGNTETS